MTDPRIAVLAEQLHEQFLPPDWCGHAVIRAALEDDR